jgi:hypothetical protein
VSESIALISAELTQGKNLGALLDGLRYADTRWMAPPKSSAPDSPERKRVVRVSLKKTRNAG